MSDDHASENLRALEQAEARRAPTPGVHRWFVILRGPAPERQATMRIRVPKIA